MGRGLGALHCCLSPPAHRAPNPRAPSKAQLSRPRCPCGCAGLLPQAEDKVEGEEDDEIVAMIKACAVPGLS